MADDREPNPSDDSGIEATRVGQPAAADEEGGTSIIESPFDQGAPAPARLVIVSGPNAGLRRDLPDGPFVLGRGTDCDLVLDDPAVSRRHVRLFAVGRMRFAQDLGSGNGTMVGGRRTDRFPLGGGVEFALGGTVIRIEQDAAPVAAAPAEPDAGEDADATRMVSFPLPEAPPATVAPTPAPVTLAPPPRLQIPTRPATKARGRLPVAAWIGIAVVTGLVALGVVLWIVLGGKPASDAPAAGDAAPPATAAVQEEPSDYDRAMQALSERRWDAALHLLDQVAARAPDTEGLDQARARARDERRNMQLLEAAKRSLDRDESPADALAILGRVDPASVYHEDARQMAAQVESRRIGLEVEGIREMVRNRQSAQARDAFIALVERHPEDAMVLGLKKELETAGVLAAPRAAAAKPAEKAPAEPRGGNGDLSRANALYNQGEFERAQAAAEEAAGDGADNGSQRARQTAARIGRFAKAYKDGTRALMARDFDAARRDLTTALSVDANLTRHYQAEIRGMLGEAFRALAAKAADRGDCTAATESARKALEYRPGDALAGRILQKCGAN